MSIELLWIIPIIAFSFFIFLLVYNISKRQDNPYKDLSNEVARFNYGIQQPVQLQITPEKRLDELEKAIISVNESIANQQKLMEKVNKESTSSSSEIEELRKKLHELQKEYDIVISENYSLRAKVKYLIETKGAVSDKNIEDDSSKTPAVQNGKGKINLKLYEDTRLMSLSQLQNIEESDKAADVG